MAIRRRRKKATTKKKSSGDGVVAFNRGRAEKSKELLTSGGKADIKKWPEGKTKHRIIRRPQDDFSAVWFTVHFVPTKIKDEETGKTKTIDLPYACLQPGANPYLDGKIKGSHCNFCQTVEELRDEGSETSMELANKMRAKKSGGVYAERIKIRDGETSHEEPAIRRCSAKTVLDYILDAECDPDTGEYGLSHPTKRCPLLSLDYDKGRGPRDMYKLKTIATRGNLKRPAADLDVLRALPDLRELLAPRILGNSEITKLLDTGRLPKSAQDRKSRRRADRDTAGKTRKTRRRRSSEEDEEEETPRRRRRSKTSTASKRRTSKTRTKKRKRSAVDPSWDDDEDAPF